MAMRQRNALTPLVKARQRHTACSAFLSMSSFKGAFAIFLTLFGKTALAGSVSVLFVGNSLTQVNDLPGVFKQFAAESPLHLTVEVSSITPGGAFLYDH